MSVLLIVALPGCVAPWLDQPLREDKELNAVLDAYKKQNAELTARHEAAASQGIGQLAIIKGAGAEETLVTLELDRASLPVVIGRILHEAGVSYVVEPGLLRGAVTSRLTSVPLVRAINALLAPRGLVAVMHDNVLAIREADLDDPVTVQPLAGRKPADKAGAQGQSPAQAARPTAGGGKPGAAAKSEGSATAKPQPKPVVTREVPLLHLDAAMASAFLEGLAKKAATDTDPGLRFSLQPYTNTVFLSGSADAVASAATALRGADRDPAHVVIEVLVVEMGTTGTDELGVDLKNTAKSGTQFTTAFGSLVNPALTYATGVKDPRGLRVQIQMLVSRNKARIIARPYLTTTSGRKAKIEITNDQYLIVQQASGGASIATPQSVSTGVKLEILPHVARDGKVRMDVVVEQSQFAETTNENVATEVAKNLAQTTMEVESGQAILIGGMSQHQSSTSSSGLPWLRNIPFLNIFFSKFDVDSRRQEVLVYLTPYVVWSPDLTSPIPESDAFGPKEPRDLYGTIEGNRE